MPQPTLDTDRRHPLDTRMERPAKKPRRREPEGFQKSKPTTPYKPSESITKFVSTFDDTAKLDSPTKKKRASLSIVGERPRTFVDFDVRPEPGPSSDRPSASRRLTVPHVDLTPLKALKSPVFTAHAEPSTKSTNALNVLQPVPKPRFVLKPPPVRKPPQTAHTSSLTSLQPIRNPPLEKPRSILKPPPPPISLSKPAAPLKPIAPPPLPTTTSPKKPMKTILTTNIAQAIDPTKEGAGPELLSLFLQQHGHNFTSSTDRELQRGVMVSPDKRSRGKDRKFVRGGLAERFEHRIACAKTDLVLWKRQTEQKVESGSKLAPDMQLRVLRILDCKTQRPSRLASGPRAGLALCRLLRRHPLAGDLAHGTYVVVFHFATTDSRSAVNSPDRFEEGNDVMVWMPWHKVELVGKEQQGLLDMFRTLDALTPPRSLLVVSRFCLIMPRVDNAA